MRSVRIKLLNGKYRPHPGCDARLSREQAALILEIDVRTLDRWHFKNVGPPRFPAKKGSHGAYYLLSSLCEQPLKPAEMGRVRVRKKGDEHE